MYLCTRIFAQITFINYLSSMNQYETVFILTPVLSDEQMKETVAKFKKVLTEDGLCYPEEIYRFLLPGRVQG